MTNVNKRNFRATGDGGVNSSGDIPVKKPSPSSSLIVGSSRLALSKNYIPSWTSAITVTSIDSFTSTTSLTSPSTAST
jgi:hypothetical protein